MTAAFFSGKDSTEPERPAVEIVPEQLHQLEGRVNLPKTGHPVQGSEPTCQNGPRPKDAHSSEAVCRDVLVTGIPAGSRIVSVTSWVKEPNSVDWKPRSRPEDDRSFCGIEGLQFLRRTLTQTTGPSGITVTWTAMNTRADRAGDAQVLVQFYPPTELAVR